MISNPLVILKHPTILNGAAIIEEFNAFVHNYTWTLVPCCNNVNVLTCKWVYKNKYLSDCSIEWYMAHLVRGFAKYEGLDYHDTFSLRVKLTVIHVILSLALFCG